MKIAALIVGLAGLGLTVPAAAALAPNYQRLAELNAILAHPGVIEAFTVSQPIDRVELVRPDLYRVTAGPCFLNVVIIDKPATPGMVGARQFAVVPDKVDCPAQ